MPFEARVLIPVCALTAALGGGAAFPAEIHKCRNSEGGTVYQQGPCEQTGSKGAKLEVVDPTKPRKSADKAKSTDAPRNATDTFQRRIENRDYQGALAIATTEAQKEEARKMIMQKHDECAALAQKVQKTRGEVRAHAPQSKLDAEAAVAEYDRLCK